MTDFELVARIAFYAAFVGLVQMFVLALILIRRRTFAAGSARH
jgi:hypothetical protein